MVSEVSMPYKKLGTWISRAEDTVYQALTDGFVMAFTQDQINPTAEGYTDSSNPPTTLRIRNRVTADTATASICFAVKKNDYWKVLTGTVTTIFWIPLEP